jgi:antitoxin FitA
LFIINNGVFKMLNINLDDNLKIKLQQQAKNKGHTLEQEVTEILVYYFTQTQEKSLNLADRIKQRFSGIDNVEIPEITRDKIRNIPKF